MNALLPYLMARDKDQIQALADACKTKPVYLSQLARGHRNAGHALARAIQQATGGEVTVHDLRPDIFGDAPQPQGQAGPD